MINEIKESPFQPGQPVSYDKFKGRNKETEKIIRYVPSVIKGNQKHFFITGKKGMGKTSFAKYVAQKVEDQFNFTTIYINNKGNESLSVLIGLLIQKLYEKYEMKGRGEKIKDTLLKYVKEINFKGTGLTFKENNEDLVESVKGNFPGFLLNVSEKLQEKNESIFFIIDDINGLSKDKDFTNWYKSFVDTLAFYDSNFTPFIFCLVGYQEEFDILTLKDSSFSRIFERVIINNIENQIIEEYFVEEFSNENIEINEKALKIMVTFSYGMPLLMQQVGDSVFWLNEDKITEKNVIDGIINATLELKEKQLKSILYQIQSQDYINILIKIAGDKKFQFKRKELENILNKNEFKKINDFLSRMKQLGILQSVGMKNSGEYEFNNPLYFVYFYIVSKYDI